MFGFLARTSAEATHRFRVRTKTIVVVELVCLGETEGSGKLCIGVLKVNMGLGRTLVGVHCFKESFMGVTVGSKAL